MLDVWDGFWFKVGGWLGEVAVTLAVLIVIVAVFCFVESFRRWRGKA